MTFQQCLVAAILARNNLFFRPVSWKGRGNAGAIKDCNNDTRHMELGYMIGRGAELRLTPEELFEEWETVTEDTVFAEAQHWQEEANKLAKLKLAERRRRLDEGQF